MIDVSTEPANAEVHAGNERCRTPCELEVRDPDGPITVVAEAPGHLTSAVSVPLAEFQVEGANQFRTSISLVLPGHTPAPEPPEPVAATPSDDSQYTPAEIAAALLPHRGELRACAPGWNGGLTLALVVDGETGLVSAASVRDAPTPQSSACMAERLRRVSFPPIGRGDRVITMPYDLTDPSTTLPATPSRQSIVRAFQRVEQQARACPSQGGTALVRVRLASDGSVTSVATSGVDFATAMCIEQAVRAQRFDAFSDASYSVNYPLRLGPR